MPGLPGMSVRAMRTPSFAAQSTRSRHHRRRLAAVAVASVIATLAVATPGRTPVVRADAPPEYYAVALGLTNDVQSLYSLNEQGSGSGVTRNQHVVRYDGSTVSPIAMPSGYLTAINGSGAMIGYTSESGGSQGVRVDGTSISPLAGMGRLYEQPTAINDAGVIIGNSSDGDGTYHVWRQDGTTVTELPNDGGSYATASILTQAGAIAGTASDAAEEYHIVIWDPAGNITDLGLAGGSYGNPTDMNADGHLIGGIGIPLVGDHGVYWDGTTLVDMGTMGGSTTYANDINDAGQILVSSRDADGHMHAAIWHDGSFDDLGGLGGAEVYGGAINEQGQITGTSDTSVSGVTHGFLVDHGVMYDINDLLPAALGRGHECWSDHGLRLHHRRQPGRVRAPGPRPTTNRGLRHPRPRQRPFD